ncbi:MAG TPA: DUF4124 domain-containing protein, partial [Chromatiaceae bacterium]|nr:DUF4124 domain-containing protein [Chromatiaceae bacterium]
MKMYAIFLFLLATAVVEAGIYKWVDSAGNIHYGDEPGTSGAKQMEKLPGLSTYAPPPMPEKAADQIEELEMDEPASEVKEEKVKAFSYRELTIVSPDDGGVVRSSPGTVSVFVALAPVLRKGDYLKVILDGAALEKKYYSTVMQLQTVDRGMHQLAVAVFDKTGKKL